MACAVLVAIAAQVSQAAVHYKTITFLHTNDVHGHLFPFLKDGKSVGGYERHATIFARFGVDKPRVIIASAGDTWNRGPLEELNGKPDIQAMGQMGYKLWTLGNGEFYAGVPNIEIREKEAKFPCLSANVTFKSGGYLAKPYTILTLDGIRVGVFGLSAPRVASYAVAKDLNVADPVQTARRITDELRPKVDLLVGLTHIGVEMDTELARKVSGIDLIIGGDSHTRLDHPLMIPRSGSRKPLEIKAVPVAQAECFGRFIGHTTMYLRSEDDGPWRVISAVGDLIPVDAAIPSNPQIHALLERYVKPLRRIVGAAAEEFLESKDKGYPMAELTARFAREAAEADVGVYNLGGVQAGLPNGPVTRLDIASALPFTNRLISARLSARQVIRLLELEPSVANGAHFEYDSSGKVINLTVAGRRLSDKETLIVATTSWAMRTALGDSLLEAERDLGDFRALFEKWFAKNSPVKLR